MGLPPHLSLYPLPQFLRAWRAKIWGRKSKITRINKDKVIKQTCLLSCRGAHRTRVHATRFIYFRFYFLLFFPFLNQKLPNRFTKTLAKKNRKYRIEKALRYNIGIRRGYKIQKEFGHEAHLTRSTGQKTVKKLLKTRTFRDFKLQTSIAKSINRISRQMMAHFIALSFLNKPYKFHSSLYLRFFFAKNRVTHTNSQNLTKVNNFERA